MTALAPRQPAINPRRLAHNTLFNLVGRVLPLLAGLVATPFLINGLGPDRFGVLALVWTIGVYFSLADLGIGRATTKFVADRLARQETSDLPGLVWTSWALLLGVGCGAGLLLLLLRPVVVGSVLSLPDNLREETSVGLLWLAVSLPFLLTTLGVAGVFAAQQRFDLVNAVQAPLLLGNFLVPVLCLPFTNSLGTILAALAVTRALICVLGIALCVRGLPALRATPVLDRHQAGRLVSFGGWLMGSNLLSAIMWHGDRLLIGVLLSVAALAYYVPPFTLATQLWILPGSLLGVLFPAFSGLVQQRSATVVPLYRRTIKYVFLVLAPLALVLMVLAPEIISLWLGPSFVDHSAAILSWLTLGVLVNSLAQVPYTLIQAAGRPDVTLKLYLLEIIPYAIVLWLLVERLGLIGAAIAWVLRILLDAALLFWYANRLLPLGRRSITCLLAPLPIALVLAVVMGALTRLVSGPLAHGAIVLAVLLAVAPGVWLFWLDRAEKEVLRQGAARFAGTVRGLLAK